MQRPLQKNRSLTLTTVWGENVSGPEHCQNPPGAVCSYWSGMRERNREQKERGIERKRDIGAWFLSSAGQEQDGWCWQGIYLLPKRPLKRGTAAQSTQTKSHDDKHNTFFFPSKWFSLSDPTTGILTLLHALIGSVNLQSEPIWSDKNIVESFSLLRNLYYLFWNVSKMCFTSIRSKTK